MTELAMNELTMLTEMLSADLPTAIADMRALDLHWLDLKGGVFGKSIEALDPADNERLAALLDRTDTRAYCFSSTLGHWNIDTLGLDAFRREMEGGVTRLLQTAETVRPRFVRLLACCFDARGEWPDSDAYLCRHASGVYDVYREAVSRLHEAGLRVTIENEPGSIFCHPDETIAFFERLGCGASVGFTWDVQNMWASGVFPTLEVYEALRPWINYVHLKGGRANPADGRTFRYRSVLERADWPVREIVTRVLRDNVSPVLCLNCSHGEPTGDDPLRSLWGSPQLAAEEARLDVAFLRATFADVA